MFVSQEAQGGVDPSRTETYSTTAATKLKNTATIDPSVLATSNGNSAKDRKLASTSEGSSAAGPRTAGVVPGVTLLGMLVGGAWVAGVAVRRYQ